MSTRLDPFTFPHKVTIVRESDRAVVIQYAKGDAAPTESWVPKVCIHDDSPVWEVGHSGILIVVESFAEKEGWVDAKPRAQPAITKCRSCGATIRWGKTAAGKSVPIDVAPSVTADGNKFWPSHFTTCKQASEWSKR